MNFGGSAALRAALPPKFIPGLSNTAIVTGAGTSIGEAIAHKFAKEGAKVVEILGRMPGIQ